MKWSPSDYEGIGSREEELFFAPWRWLRQKFLSFLTIPLARLGISADMLSFASVIPGIGFCLLAPSHYTIAFWLLAISLVFDGLDGVLARQTKTNTIAGAFTDMCCDAFVLACCVAGLTWKGMIHPALAIIFIYSHVTLGVFFLLHHLLKVSRNGIVRPGKTFFCLALGLEFFFHINTLNYLLGIYLLTLPLLVISFWRLKKAL